MVYTPEFFTYVLNSPMTNARVREMTGGASSPHLNVGDVKAFPIPLPHPNEQQEVVRSVEALFALADAAEHPVPRSGQRQDCQWGARDCRQVRFVCGDFAVQNRRQDTPSRRVAVFARQEEPLVTGPGKLLRITYEAFPAKRQ